VPIFIFIFSALVFIMFIFTGIKGIGQWQHNNNQPILIVSAKLISRRTNVSTSMHSNSDGINSHTNSSTSYYITFEVEGGSRMEFQVKGHEYGLLIDGDIGKLKFQGTRYISFERSFD
jgi:hypothetical protein